MATDITESAELGEINKYNFRTETTGVFKAQKGINAGIVNQISDIKNEPDWMREFRLKSLEIFESRPMPKWGGDIDIDFQDIFYYLKPTNGQGRTWDDVPQEIKDTFDKLGIPEAEKVPVRGQSPIRE
jgi:Fe-S cluster assembly protein SufB